MSILPRVAVFGEFGYSRLETGLSGRPLSISLTRIFAYLPQRRGHLNGVTVRTPRPSIDTVYSAHGSALYGPMRILSSGCTSLDSFHWCLSLSLARPAARHRPSDSGLRTAFSVAGVSEPDGRTWLSEACRSRRQRNGRRSGHDWRWTIT